MNYITTLVILLAYCLHYFLTIFYTIFIVAYRLKARNKVYNYYIKTNKFNFLLTNNLPSCQTGDYIFNILAKRTKKVSLKENIIFNFYYWFIWLFLNDNAGSDIVDYKYLYSNKIFKKKIVNDMNNESGVNTVACKDEKCLDHNIKRSYSLITVYLYILSTNRSNFYYTYFYSNDSKYRFNIRINNYLIGWVYYKTYAYGDVYRLGIKKLT